MTKQDSPVPLYIQIKDYIRRNIEHGVFPVNTRIPSERQLAQQFEVNRLTAGKAIKDLVQEGLIYPRVGKGTYVCPPKINQALQSLSSFTDDMRRRGQRPSSRVLHVGIEPADDETARALGLIPGTECLTLIRVRMADDEPIALEKCYVVYTLCPKILDHHDFAQESLYQVLREEYGIRMTYAHQTIEAQVVNDDEIRSALETKHGAPILSVVRVTYNDQDEPFEYVRSAYRGDRYKFHTVLRLVE